MSEKEDKKEEEKKESVEEDDDDDDDDVPLAKIAPAKSAFPTDEELRDRVTAYLKTANLNEISMKVVRNSVSYWYLNIFNVSKLCFSFWVCL